MLFTKLESNGMYRIYDKDGNFKYEKSSLELKQYWEDKTKSSETNSLQEKSKIIKADFKGNYEPIKDPVSKVYKSRIYEETDNGFWIVTI